MLTEPLPINLFIETCFERKEIKSITDQWRVETGEIKEIMISYFGEMGIYSVTPELESYVRRQLPDLLRSSPEIVKKVADAERREKLMSRSRRLTD